MKLHEIPHNSELKIELDDGTMADFIYDHPDGMYSYCYLKSDPSKLLHLSHMTPLKKAGVYYEIEEAQDE